MKFLNKLERKYGRYAVSGLMRYIVLINLAGAAIGILAPEFYYQYLILDFNMILKGQIWRLFTYILFPGLTKYDLMNPMSILWFGIGVYLYYWIGNSLENAWGSFRFNLYYISGYILNIVASVIIYIIIGISFPIGLEFINQSLFLAFAALYPDIQLLLFFIIPVKVKWLGILYGGILAYEVISNIWSGEFVIAFALVIAMLNFLLFFFGTRNYARVSPKQMRRRATYKREVNKAAGGISRHKCAICGRTELDDENLEFRFCSKCDGNYEYCTEHLFTHQHVHKH